MPPTHVITINGRTSFELADTFRPVIDQVATMLGRLDGTTEYAVLVGRLPSQRRFPDVDVTEEVVEYLQCAGSAMRMTVELRRRGEDGFEQFVVGRADDVCISGSETIEWDGHVLEVRSTEVFSDAEALQIFSCYLETDSVPPLYQLRPLVG